MHIVYELRASVYFFQLETVRLVHIGIVFAFSLIASSSSNPNIASMEFFI